MKLKFYYTPTVEIADLKMVDIMTSSTDNDAVWDSAWNDD